MLFNAGDGDQMEGQEEVYAGSLYSGFKLLFVSISTCT